MRDKLKRWWPAVVGVLVVVLGTAAWYSHYYRKEPLERLTSFTYWWERLHGRDMYESRGILWHGNRRLHEIALTFDDGPQPPATEQVLDALKAAGVHATFFLVGTHVKDAPDLVKRELAEGHEIGCHSYDHQPMTALDEKHVYEQIWDSRILLDPLGGHFVGFRPPWARFTDAVIGGAVQNHLPVIMYTVSTDCYPGKSPQHWASLVPGHVENGSIIIMHDSTSYPGTAEGLPQVLAELKSAGYTFVTISEMLSHLPPTDHPTRL